MADANARAELERTQMELRDLKRELEAWPVISPEREDLEAEVDVLSPQVQQLGTMVADLQRREAVARDAIAERGGDPWWTTPWAKAAGLSGIIFAFALANWSFDYVNWVYWSPRLAPVLLAVAPLVNTARCVRAWLKKPLRR